MSPTHPNSLQTDHTFLCNRSYRAPPKQTFPSAEFAVDSFFMLSGCLGAYLLAREVAAALPSWAAATAAGTAGGGDDAAQVKEWLASAWARVAAAACGRIDSAARGARLLDGEVDDDGDSTGGYEEDGNGGSKPAHAAPPVTWLRSTATLAGLYASLVVHRFLRLWPSLFGATACISGSSGTIDEWSSIGRSVGRRSR